MHTQSDLPLSTSTRAPAQRLVPVTARGLLGANRTLWAVTAVYTCTAPGRAAGAFGEPYVTIGEEDRPATPEERRTVLGSASVQAILAVRRAEASALGTPWRMALCEDPRYPGIPFVLEGDEEGVYAVNGLELASEAREAGIDACGLPGAMTVADLDRAWMRATGGV